MKLEDIEPGQVVRYIPRHARTDSSAFKLKHQDVERGLVTSKNNVFAFVQFNYSPTSKACSPETLTPL